MRTLAFLTAAGLCLAPLPAFAGDKAAPSGSCGTSIDFYDTPKEAARQAEKEEKLVFVLHVSGNFEDPRFT
jgi:hypothetical protein